MADFDAIPTITALVGGFLDGLVGQLFGKGTVKSFGGSHTPQTIFEVTAGLGGAALSAFSKDPKLQEIGTASLVGSGWALASRVPMAVGVKPIVSSASSYAAPAPAAAPGCASCAARAQQAKPMIPPPLVATGIFGAGGGFLTPGAPGAYAGRGRAGTTNIAG